VLINMLFTRYVHCDSLVIHHDRADAANEVALFRSLDPVYGYGTKPDFDSYFAKHGEKQ
jgi:hypothetical protein